MKPFFAVKNLVLVTAIAMGIGACSSAVPEEEDQTSTGIDTQSPAAAAKKPAKRKHPPLLRRKPRKRFTKAPHYFPKHYVAARPNPRIPETPWSPAVTNNNTGGAGYPCSSQYQCAHGLMCLNVDGTYVGYKETGVCGTAALAGWANGTGDAPGQPTYGPGSSCTQDSQCGYGMGCDTSIGLGQCRPYGQSFCGQDADCGILDFSMCNTQTHQCFTGGTVGEGSPEGPKICLCGAYPMTSDGVCAALDCYQEYWADCGLAGPPPSAPCTEE